MSSLFRFIDFWNTSREGLSSNDKIVQLYTKAAQESFVRQFMAREYRPIGLSQLGKPLVEVAYSIYAEEEEIDFPLRFTFHIGDIVEALLVAAMLSYGLDVSAQQLEVEYKGVGGHIDCMVGGDLLVEIKSMSSTYFRQFTSNPDDERGYITQLALYSKAVQSAGYSVRKAGWLCLDKTTGYLKWVALPLNYVAPSLKKASRIIKQLEDIMDEADKSSDPAQWVVDNVKPPEPIPEFRNKVKTGKLLLPKGMQYSRLKYLSYPTEDGVYVDPYGWEAKWGKIG